MKMYFLLKMVIFQPANVSLSEGTQLENEHGALAGKKKLI